MQVTTAVGIKSEKGDVVAVSSQMSGHVTWASPAARTGRRRPLVPRGTSGAGRAKPECQCAGFLGPFVSRRVGTAADGFGQSDVSRCCCCKLPPFSGASSGGSDRKRQSCIALFMFNFDLVQLLFLCLSSLKKTRRHFERKVPKLQNRLRGFWRF